MNYLNFERKYVRDTFNQSNHCIWKHTNGTECDIDLYWEDNHVYVNFVDGPTLTVEIKGSVIKVGLHDDFRTRDFSTHHSWDGEFRGLLVKIYLRHILGQRTTHEQREALWDIVSNELVF